jgi:hypothetical protein
LTCASSMALCTLSMPTTLATCAVHSETKQAGRPMARQKMQAAYSGTTAPCNQRKQCAVAPSQPSLHGCCHRNNTHTHAHAPIPSILVHPLRPCMPGHHPHQYAHIHKHACARTHAHISQAFTHLLGQCEPDGACPAAHVQQQAVGPHTRHLAYGVVQGTCACCIHLHDK